MGSDSFLDGLISQVRSLFERGSVKKGNVVFSLHQSFTFVGIVVGLLFITSMNYFSSNAITCQDENEYVRNYCFLHGSSHVRGELRRYLSSGTSCTANDQDDDEGPSEESRNTNYYIWLPSILISISLITRLPGIIWTNLFEMGKMERLVEEVRSGNPKVIEKTGAKLQKMLKGRIQPLVYNLGFALCEILNMCAIPLNGTILDLLFNKKFTTYGLEAYEYFSFERNPRLPEQTTPPNPLCNVFPTEVSCTVFRGSITGNANKENTLCLLSNNVFNQFYFLILWWWWASVFAISCIGLVYRLCQLVIPGFGRLGLFLWMNMMTYSEESKKKVTSMRLGPTQTFFLGRLLASLKGSQGEQLLEKMHLAEEEAAVRLTCYSRDVILDEIRVEEGEMQMKNFRNSDNLTVDLSSERNP